MNVMRSPNGFKRYFSLEEAAELLPAVRTALRRAQQEVAELRDAAILCKRILVSKDQEGLEPFQAEIDLLNEKLEIYEQTVIRWMAHFTDQGIILRDLDAGLLDFPYHSERTGQDYFLCWRSPEDGLFYFHSVNAGFAGRHPISLLPE